MGRDFFAIITGGGSGTRMGAGIPKQFLEFSEGKCILQASIERFLEACPDATVVTVLPKDHIGYWKLYCLEHNFTVKQLIVEGGFTRFHSVKNALARIPDGAIVAIHDAVRPFVSPELIRSMRETAEEKGSAIPVLPATDTLKYLDKTAEGLKECGEKDPDRSRIFGAQTPQVFRSEDIKKAYSQAFDTLFTDDASVAKSKGIPLTFVEGERFNIKITTKEDLILSQAILTLLKKR